MYISFAIFTRLLNPNAPHFENTMILSIVRRLAMASECCVRGPRRSRLPKICAKDLKILFLFPFFFDITSSVPSPTLSPSSPRTMA